jgi:hypothetical protein
VQRLKQIDRFNDEAKIIQNVVIHIVKHFLNPILHKKVRQGWFFVPSAFQAKIDHLLDNNLHIELTPSLLRKYYMYLNILDSSTKKPYVI